MHEIQGFKEVIVFTVYLSIFILVLVGFSFWPLAVAVGSSKDGSYLNRSIYLLFFRKKVLSIL